MTTAPLYCARLSFSLLLPICRSFQGKELRRQKNFAKGVRKLAKFYSVRSYVKLDVSLYIIIFYIILKIRPFFPILLILTTYLDFKSR